MKTREDDDLSMQYGRDWDKLQSVKMGVMEMSNEGVNDGLSGIRVRVIGEIKWGKGD